MIIGSTRLLRPLDAGGMGALWVGEDIATKTQVAVKLMLPELADEDPTATGRFDREGKVLAQVKHPHVVTLFDAGALPDGTPYIVMELLSGESLVERLMRTEKELTLAQTTDLICQVCDALEHIHGRGIIHRDLKGENTFLLGTSDNIYVKLLDFGLAKAPGLPGAPALTVPGQQIGSPEYMSPEQVMGSLDVDTRADLWGVGVLAYVALTLGFPFQSERLPDLLSAIMRAEFPAASQANSAVPVALDAWFQRAFHIKRAERFASAVEMKQVWCQASGQQPSGQQPRGAGVAQPLAAAAPEASTPFPVAIAIAIGVSLLLLVVAVALLLG
jgi:serine/threonine-protein kinase